MNQLNVSRRALLGGAVAATGLTACAQRPADAGSGAAEVIVIGAGFAGIAAARRLRAAGRTVIVLEARDRIGGRVHTITPWSGDLAGTPVDIGASWIHTPRGNPLTPLAKKTGQRLVSTSYDSGELYVDPALTDQGYTRPRTAHWEAVVERAIARAKPRESLLHAVQRQRGAQGLSAAEQADLDFYLSATYQTEFGVDASELSARYADQGKEYAGDDLLLPQGYQRFLTALADGLDIRRGEVVEAVITRRGGVEVTTSQHSFSAEHVVVTVPLGVLKAGTIAFEPGLPERARKAIDRLEMGCLSKTFLRFESAFWDAGLDWHEYVSGRRGRWEEWVSFARLDQPVLLGFNAGEFARQVERMDPDDVRTQAHAVLRRMFGRSTPEPVEVHTSAWSLDEFARGSYSFNSVRASPADRRALARPLGRVLLAGEATEPSYFSAVHGAWLSGRRAAKQVLAGD